MVGLMMMRPFGALLMVPLFKPTTLGGSLARNALVLMIALPLLPMYDSWPALTHLSTSHATRVVWIVAGELCVGVMIGFCAAVPFWALDMAGFLIDTMRGASMASVLNPLLGQSSSLFGIVFSQVFSVLFLVLGGFNTLIEAIYRSYVTLPPGEVFNLSSKALAFLTHEWQLMYELCLRFSMPAMVAILLVDMALGLINRSAQQLNVFFLSMPIKSAFALLMVIMSASFAFRLMLNHSEQIMQKTATLLELMR